MPYWPINHIKQIYELQAILLYFIFVLFSAQKLPPDEEQ